MNKLENKVLQELVDKDIIKYIGREYNYDGVENDYECMEYKGMFFVLYYKKDNDLLISIDYFEEDDYRYIEIKNVVRKEELIKSLEKIRNDFIEYLKDLEEEMESLGSCLSMESTITLEKLLKGE